MHMQAQSRGRSTAPIHSQPSTRRWVVSTSFWLLYSQERPITHCTGGWVIFRSGLDGHRKFCPHRDLIPRLSSLYQVATSAPLCMACLEEICGNKSVFDSPLLFFKVLFCITNTRWVTFTVHTKMQEYLHMKWLLFWNCQIYIKLKWLDTVLYEILQ
jgi:hypothetical protein